MRKVMLLLVLVLVGGGIVYAVTPQKKVRDARDEAIAAIVFYKVQANRLERRMSRLQLRLDAFRGAENRVRERVRGYGMALRVMNDMGSDDDVFSSASTRIILLHPYRDDGTTVSIRIMSENDVTTGL